MADSCRICHGSGRLKVGVSFPPKKTIAVTVEYDPCPACQPGPHSFHAKKVARQMGWIASPAPGLSQHGEARRGVSPQLEDVE